jgi:transcriptional regulator with XRE-family HTH domain
MDHLGHSIKEAREAKGWTQSDLAVRLDVTRLTICYWETGKRTPRPRRMPGIAKTLGLRVVWTGRDLTLLPKAA